MTQDGTGTRLLDRLPDDDRELLASLGALASELGTTAYVVGGVVRDLLLERPNYDLDIVVEGDAVAFSEAAAERFGGSVKTHTRFGTVILVLPGGRKIDLATARSEIYERPGALPAVTPGSMDNDLERRDFTVNSMAIVLNPERFNELLDPFGGRADLDAGVLRVLTEVSFEDDPTRVLRGVRFSARFGLSIDTATEALLRRAVSERRTDTVSGERLLNEIELILREEDPWPPVFRLIDWGILASMVEGWDVPLSVREAFVEVERLLTKVEGGGPERWRTLFLTLLAPVPAATRSAVVERLAAGRRIRETAAELDVMEEEVLPELSEDAEPLPSRLFELLDGFTDETLLVARATSSGSPAAARIERFTSDLKDVRPSIGGSDLREMGVPEGREVGNILAALRRARLDGDVTSDEEEKALALSLAGSLTNEARVGSVAPEPTTSETVTEGVPEAEKMPQAEHPDRQSVAEAEPQESPDGSPVEPATESPTEPPVVAEEDSAKAEAAGTVVATASPAPEDSQTLVRRPSYEVKLDAFEGPLDLLLHLIRDHEIDIYDIPIAVITQQYLDYINFMESLDLALAGEFLEMAATLIRIKVQMLLPKETDEDGEEEDPREQLVRKLVEYKQFKEVASNLSEKESDRRDYFPRGVDPKSYADIEEEEMDIEEFLRDVTLFDLVDSLREVLSRVPERVDVHAVDMESVTVEQQLDHIRNVISKRGSVPFVDVFGEGAGRFEIIATFIALLELIRLGEVRALQKGNFAEIEIQARVEE